MKTAGLFLIIIMCALTAHGQTNLTLPVYKRIVNSDYENDLFAQTDRYYSQGIRLDYAFMRDPLKIRQFRSKPVRTAFSMGLTHEVYTPSTIRKDSALYNDRPYAALISGRFNYLFIDTVRQFSVSAGLETGIVGPFALGEEMQTAIHKATNNPVPLGWQYQIVNGLIFDANIGAEKSFFKWRNAFQAIGKVDVRFGTFQTNLKPSLTLMSGSLKQYKAYLYSITSVKGVARDGTLQGSLIGGNSPVVVSGKDLNRVVVQEEIGFRFQTRFFGASVHYSIQSSTFRYQEYPQHEWGGIGLFLKF